MMVDVIGTHPAEARPDLLVKIRALCSDACANRSYLPKPAIPGVPPRARVNEFQIIDNVVLLEDLLNEGAHGGIQLKTLLAGERLDAQSVCSLCVSDSCVLTPASREPAPCAYYPT